MNAKEERAFVKGLRRWRRGFAAEYPAFARKLRRMTDAQLGALESQLLEQQIAFLRHKPGFDKDAAAQSLVANYEYDLRLARELAMWRAVPRPRIARRPYNPDGAPEQSPTAMLAGSATPNLGPAQGNAPLASVEAREPEPAEHLKPAPSPPSNVIPLRPFRPWGKCFHGGVELTRASVPNSIDYEVW